MTSRAATAVGSSSTIQSNRTQGTMVNNQAQSEEAHSANSANTNNASGQTSSSPGYSTLRWKGERPEEEPWNELAYQAKKEQGKG